MLLAKQDLCGKMMLFIFIKLASGQASEIGTRESVWEKGWMDERRDLSGWFAPALITPQGLDKLTDAPPPHTHTEFNIVWSEKYLCGCVFVYVHAIVWREVFASGAALRLSSLALSASCDLSPTFPPSIYLSLLLSCWCWMKGSIVELHIHGLRVV